jgi:Mrp family chromosome partitioning ATPase
MNAFLREGYDQAKVAWLRTRLSELRREFDYTIIHTPAVAVSGDAILFGRLCDGVILILEAQRTRRATACAACDALRQANVRLLGSVLSDRTFPIPQSIYSKL